jgi:exodeoxyribonuclease-3
MASVSAFCYTKAQAVDILKIATFNINGIRSRLPALHSGHPVVLAGDYNVVPSDEDIYNPRSWLKDALLQPESRERYQRLLAQGWTDSVRARYPDERIYTFWDYFRQHWQKNSGLRIDHLLLNAELAPRLRSAGVDRWVRDRPHASDHAPTWIELDMGAKNKGAKRPRGTVKRSNTPVG